MSAKKQKHKHLLNSSKKHYSGCVGSSAVVIVVCVNNKDGLLAAVLTRFTF